MNKTIIEIAKEFNISLKKVKTFEGHDGLGFNAEVCLNGKAFATAYDDAHGGCMDINAIGGCIQVKELKTNREIIKKLNKELTALPKTKTENFGQSFEMDTNLEYIIDCLVDEFVLNKQHQKDKKKGILIKVDGGYSIVKFKAGTITAMLKQYPKKAVSMMIQGHVTKYIKDGETIINAEYLESIGVKIK